MTNYPSTQLFIDGIWRASSDGRSIDVTDPSSEEVIGKVAHASRADLDAALAAAERGFAVWRDTSPVERARLMHRAADLLRERVDQIAEVMTREQGKPKGQSAIETSLAADVIDWFAEEGRRTYGRLVPPRSPGVTQMMIRLPVGPVAAFTPWNFPINQVVRKLSATLAAGCSIIVKGPEETPAAPAELIRAFADAGVPAGVINLVYGVPAEISEYLIPHPVIRKISFTGSTPVGKHLAAMAGAHMKRVTMELGGHAPVLVFEDARVDEAANMIGAAKFRNAGQVCVAPTRFLVQEGVADHFTDALIKHAQGVKVGNGLDADSQMGPLINSRRLEAVSALVNEAVEQGAKLLTGGRRIGNKGWYYEPTVLADVPVTARIMNEEPFGPVAIVNRYPDYDGAISEANRLPFGLASYAFTTSAATMHALGRDVRAGMLTINHLGLALPEVPFGGTGDSGYGTEGGPEAIEAYLETKFVTQTA